MSLITSKQVVVDQAYPNGATGTITAGDSLTTALTKISNNSQITAIIPEYNTAPVNPVSGQAWVLHTPAYSGGDIVGFLGAFPLLTNKAAETWKLQINTFEGVKSVALT